MQTMKSLSAAVLLTLAATLSATAAEQTLPPATVDEPASGATTEVAVLAGGCFWGVQGVFQHVKGVTNAVSGYAGGSSAAAHYETVSDGDTGHAESVQVTFDPRQITYGQILQIFFAVAHDPTELNRQGPDVGTQYRSVIFYHSPEQEAAAKASKEALAKSGRYKRPIVTEIVPAPAFWRAEEYHQQYLEKRGLSHCHI